MEKFIFVANVILVCLIVYTIYKTYFLREGAKGCDATAAENDAKNRSDSMVGSLNSRIANLEVLLNTSKSVVEGQRSELEKIKEDLEKDMNEQKKKMENTK